MSLARPIAWLLGCASALAIVSVAVPSGATGPTSDEGPGPAAPTGGAAVYTDTCAKCHGEDGKGDTGMGKKARDAGQKWPDLTKSTIDGAKAKTIIENGVENTKMKGFASKLTAEQITSVRDFVMALRKP